MHQPTRLPPVAPPPGHGGSPEWDEFLAGGQKLAKVAFRSFSVTEPTVYLVWGSKREENVRKTPPWRSKLSLPSLDSDPRRNGQFSLGLLQDMLPE